MEYTEVKDVKIGLATIWAIGVGSALGGDFFGWQFVLFGGFGSAFVAVIFTGVFYWLYAGAITELAARYQSSGGSFDFVRNALGEKPAALMAILGLLKLILANSANALAISSYLTQGGASHGFHALFWLGCYSIFTYLDCIGVRQSANIQIIATVLCVAVLLFYCGSSFSIFDRSNIYSAGYTHGGAEGFLKGLPFALQFFDGFEEVPLLMGYAHDPEKTIPRAILACYLTISTIAVLILISGAGSVKASYLLNSDAPLMDGFELVYGSGTFLSDILAYFIALGLLVNFFAFVLFCSQQIQAIAEAGQLPKFLAYRHPVHGAPIRASITASLIGLFLTMSFAFAFGEDPAQDTLVTAALMPAVLGYALLLQCIIKIRQTEKNIISIKSSNNNNNSQTILGYEPKELRFAFGGIGARIAQIMCLIFAIGLIVLAFVSLDFMYGLIVVFILGCTAYLLMNFYIKSEDNIEYRSIYDDVTEETSLAKKNIHNTVEYTLNDERLIT